MAGFSKKNYGLIVVLISLLLGLPFFHYHPEKTHTHQSELPSHHHEGHLHSHELNGFASLIDFNSSNSSQSEGHHHHSENNADTNDFEINPQKSGLTPVKIFKNFKSGTVQKLFSIPKPALFHFEPLVIQDFWVHVLADPLKERSPPYRFV